MHFLLSRYQRDRGEQLNCEKEGGHGNISSTNGEWIRDCKLYHFSVLRTSSMAWAKVTLTVRPTYGEICIVITAAHGRTRYVTVWHETKKTELKACLSNSRDECDIIGKELQEMNFISTRAFVPILLLILFHCIYMYVMIILK